MDFHRQSTPLQLYHFTRPSPSVFTLQQLQPTSCRGVAHAVVAGHLAARGRPKVGAHALCGALLTRGRVRRRVFFSEVQSCQVIDTRKVQLSLSSMRHWTLHVVYQDDVASFMAALEAVLAWNQSAYAQQRLGVDGSPRVAYMAGQVRMVEVGIERIPGAWMVALPGRLLFYSKSGAKYPSLAVPTGPNFVGVAQMPEYEPSFLCLHFSQTFSNVPGAGEGAGLGMSGSPELVCIHAFDAPSLRDWNAALYKERGRLQQEEVLRNGRGGIPGVPQPPAVSPTPAAAAAPALLPGPDRRVVPPAAPQAAFQAPGDTGDGPDRR